jgi:hypothetical protein
VHKAELRRDFTQAPQHDRCRGRDEVHPAWVWSITIIPRARPPSGLSALINRTAPSLDACPDPTKYPAGFFSICTSSYDIPAAHVTVDDVYTSKALGGVAYRCSFR